MLDILKEVFRNINGYFLSFLTLEISFSDPLLTPEISGSDPLPTPEISVSYPLPTPEISVSYPLPTLEISVSYLLRLSKSVFWIRFRDNGSDQ